MTRLLPLLVLAATAAAADSPPAAAASPSAAAQAPAPFAPGEAASPDLLPPDWVRGEPVRAFAPGHTYVITRWNTTGGHDFAPGYNITRPLAALKNRTDLHGLVIFLHDDIPPAKLAKRLGFPSQQTPFAIAHAKPGSPSLAAYDRLGRDEHHHQDTLIVRDGRIVWAGSGFDLEPATLTEFAAPGFDYDAHVAAKTAQAARAKQLAKRLGEAFAAAKAKDLAKELAILDELDRVPDLPAFVYSRVRDCRFSIALDNKDVAGAIAEMEKLSEKYPDHPGTQSWVHKLITQTEETAKPGLRLAAKAAERHATHSPAERAGVWWQAAGQHYEDCGDKKAALAAYEAASRESGPVRRLSAMKAGRAPE